MLAAIEETQAELLRRIAEQDRLAFGEFYDQTARSLYSIACRMLGNEGEAEEVIQDAFVQIWNKAEKYDPAKGQAFHWTLALTRNLCLDRLRARQRRSRVLVEMEGEGEVESPAPAAASETAWPEADTAVIQSAMNELPPDQRQAIEMAFFGGLTHQEIADTLNEPLGTIKARVRRGMLKLRTALENFL